MLIKNIWLKQNLSVFLILVTLLIFNGLVMGDHGGDHGGDDLEKIFTDSYRKGAGCNDKNCPPFGSTNSVAAIAQDGIISENSKFSIILEASITNYQNFGKKIKEFQDILRSLQRRYPQAGLCSVVAFGNNAWKVLTNNDQSANQLKNFVQRGKGEFIAPSTQRDILFHLQCIQMDVLFSLALYTNRTFTGSIKIEEEVHCFKWEESRDFIGFIDGTVNPVGAANRTNASLVSDGQDVGGSYIMSQRFRHELDRWSKVPVMIQEQIVGRTKDNSTILPRDQRDPNAHVAKTFLGNRVLRKSMPYGVVNGGDIGLYFISYSHHLSFMEDQLKSMFGELNGQFDRLLNYTKPVTGSYWYAPSLVQLNRLN
ncbi:Dyp-type peroxidase family protein [Cavenderia fasciculata]|uniref:Dyp-type peroxidase family protein n=1 Tax=Cavenderia fasciculata TaxID=261658 RepID=F4QDP0_CACFS|nr:Dyp-type peroxidase family protein [Cavenderia fasciculata]EGG13837.1 Dyp-type peroxidase family protein [Cavenderia fasciculata]|eukprot:XP_004350545.1 Dyp-type peroxidase family protein [Cavenderia fasciculata]